MISRKQHVIKMAHQLFIDKGFQSTSIQDILDYSGISKGTFYNYFSSKNELLLALFRMIYEKLDKDRNEILIGQDPANIEIFIKQIEMQMETNRLNKLSALFEEVVFSDDVELKQFLKTGHIRMLQWFYSRFLDIFGESKKPYLLDCAIMFSGILHQNSKYYALANDANASLHRVVRYSVERVAKMVDEIAEAGEQLIQPEMLKRWSPDSKKCDQDFQQKLCRSVFVLKKNLNVKEQLSYSELLDFIQDELLHMKEPRKFLVDSAMLSLRAGQSLFDNKELQALEQLVSGYFTHAEETAKSTFL